MEEIGVSCVMLLQTVEADFVNQQDFGTQKELEFPFEGVVRERREEFTKHCCGGNIAAAEGFLTADEQKRLGNVALAGAGGSGKDQSLFSPGKIKGGQFHDLPFVETLLKVKIKVREQFTFRKLRFPDPPFDPSFDKPPDLQGPGARFCRQDALYGLAVISAILAGMTKGQIDVVGMVAFLQMQDVPGVKAWIPCMHGLKPLKKIPGMIAQFNKLLPHRFEAVADGLDPVNRRPVQGDPPSRRRPFMTDDESKFR